ncbi:hypothetical protein AKJ48_04205 [candidate division MSBL1 archaeon SCGC-AAA261O19]|uniref:Pyrroloquinoline quinone biosynthesis protein PqqD n=1 Tax=candidate division MSBL1 archaeon SCGC-AAA261O19 TaxID=1698277 RepID=A0A133V9J8_9EURY|nr:hypothetical protein AKJ48_04205 [candidate division MSBL1 archaeon SCGC-AAA261O19]
MNSFGRGDVVKFSKHAKVRMEKFGAVIFDTLKEDVFTTNEQGAEIIRLLQDGKSQSEIIEELTNEYDENHDEIASDVNNFLRELAEKEILIGVE